MSTATTAPLLSIDAAGVSFAYRRFGSPGSRGVPLVLLVHFRGNVDYWDTAFVDGLAAGREVVLVDYPGAGSSSGTPAVTVAEMSRSIAAFLAALGLRKVDLLGFSLGGFVAQELALTRLELVERLVLAGTGPRGAPGSHGWARAVLDNALPDVPSPANMLAFFFTGSEAGLAAGRTFIENIFQRQADRSVTPDNDARDAQYAAVAEWGIPDHGALQRLTGIGCPTLILQGDSDPMIPVRQSHLMAGLIPDSALHVFPDAAHGSIYQYRDRAVALIDEFLDRP